MLNTRDEQHTLSQPTRRRANTANGKEGLKHASTLRYIQNTGQGQRGGDMLRPRIKAIPCEQVGNAYVVELVQRQQQSGFGIDPQFEVNSSMMVAACGSSVSSSMELCVSSGA